VKSEKGGLGEVPGRTVGFIALLFTFHFSPFTQLVAAQQPDTLQPILPGQQPLLPGDTARVPFDSTAFPAEPIPGGARQDSLRPRNDSSRTQRYLALEKLKETKVLTAPPLEPPAPEPPFGRVVLTRDSIEWAHASTLSDLLQRVPGVYLWRGGWLGQPEYPNFQARGATSAEYWLDGVPYLAAGADSVGVDPAIFPLSMLDRVEIERWPGLLRVRLYTRNLDRLAPRSRIAVSRGAASFARYQASLERKTRSGLGFAIAGDNLSVPGIENIRAKYSNTAFFLQGTYVHSPRWGILLQGFRTRPDRDPVLSSTTDTLSRGLPGARRMDWQFRSFWRADSSGLGPRADLILARTTASDSVTPNQTINSAGLVASLRRSGYALGASAFYRSRWTSTDLRATAGWAPIGGAALSGEAAYQRHDGGRSSTWVGLRGGIRLPLGLEASASLRGGSVVAAPSVLTDPAQTLRDWQLLAGWERSWIALEGGLTHTAAYQPLSYQPYPQIPLIAPSVATDWLTARGRLTPLQWLSLEAWVSDPRKPTPDGIPPRHVLASGTIRSNFLRLFPSGTLNLELRLAVEHWNAGVIGRDAVGDPITLPSATYFRSLVQVALGSFQFFWDRANLTAKENPYVPGLPIVGRPSEFGMRWTFAN
jgi:hypothetical protein